jgi:tRNA(Arg) A34 adenosine deaminase TadA
MCLAATYWARIPTLFFGNRRSDAAAIGFDDEFLYEQLALPLPQRRVVMRELLRAEASLSFREWLQKVDRTTY